MWGPSLLFVVFIGVYVGLLTGPGYSAAATHYVLQLDLAEFTGDSLRLAFDLTSGNAVANTVRTTAFSLNGRTRYPVFQAGGPVSGGLVESGLPATATIGDQFFFNGIEIPLDSVGTAAVATLDLSEIGLPGDEVQDELSFYILDAGSHYRFPTVDPLGVNALFAIDVTGQAGGDLSVFAPMEFVPPDTLVLRRSTTGVAENPVLQGRLRWLESAPNPFMSTVRLVYEVPAPGGLVRVRIFDTAGRLVAQPFSGDRAQGRWLTVWSGRDRSGRRAGAGIYLAEVQMGGQSAVRRVALTR